MMSLMLKSWNEVKMIFNLQYSFLSQFIIFYSSIPLLSIMPEFSEIITPSKNLDIYKIYILLEKPAKNQEQGDDEWCKSNNCCN